MHEETRSADFNLRISADSLALEPLTADELALQGGGSWISQANQDGTAGAFIGGGAGAVVGGIAGCADSACVFSVPQAAVGGAAGAFLGGGIGWVWGAVSSAF